MRLQDSATYNWALRESFGEVQVLSEQKVMLVWLSSQATAFEPLGVNAHVMRVVRIRFISFV